MGEPSGERNWIKIVSSDLLHYFGFGKLDLGMRPLTNITKNSFCRLQVVWSQLDHSIDKEADGGQSFQFMVFGSIFEIIMLSIYMKIGKCCGNGRFTWFYLVLIGVLMVEGPALYYLGVASHYTSGFPSKFSLSFYFKTCYTLHFLTFQEDGISHGWFWKLDNSVLLGVCVLHKAIRNIEMVKNKSQFLKVFEFSLYTFIPFILQ